MRAWNTSAFTFSRAARRAPAAISSCETSPSSASTSAARWSSGSSCDVAQQVAQVLRGAGPRPRGARSPAREVGRAAARGARAAPRGSGCGRSCRATAAAGSARSRARRGRGRRRGRCAGRRPRPPRRSRACAGRRRGCRGGGGRRGPRTRPRRRARTLLDQPLVGREPRAAGGDAGAGRRPRAAECLHVRLSTVTPEWHELFPSTHGCGRDARHGRCVQGYAGAAMRADGAGFRYEGHEAGLPRATARARAHRAAARAAAAPAHARAAGARRSPSAATASITLDLLGHGESDRPRDMWRYSMALLRAQVVALLDHLGSTRRSSAARRSAPTSRSRSLAGAGAAARHGHRDAGARQRAARLRARVHAAAGRADVRRAGHAGRRARLARLVPDAALPLAADIVLDWCARTRRRAPPCCRACSSGASRRTAPSARTFERRRS